MGGRGSGSNMGSFNASLGKIDRTGFQSMGGGQWTMDIPGVGGAQILDESDDYKYGGKAYSVHAWDGNYNEIGGTDIYGTLNAAKQAAKDKIKGAAMKNRRR